MSFAEIIRVDGCRELLVLETLRAGSTVIVEPEGHWYTSCGTFPPEARELLRWRGVRNVWIPGNALRDLEVSRGSVFSDVSAVAAIVVQDASSYHEDRRDRNSLYCVVEGEQLREMGQLTSKSAGFVDAVIEFRTLAFGVLPRLFHLSPRTRNRGGEQLWP